MSKLSYWLLPILFVGVCLAASAQTAEQDKQQMSDKSAHSQSVTGCLQKGDEAGEFSITGEDGKTWGLHSASVKLDQHLGHKVTVTGSATQESKAAEKKEGQVENASSKQEYGDIDVTSLKMVSDSCSK